MYVLISTLKSLNMTNRAYVGISAILTASLFLVDKYSSSSAVDNNPKNNETRTHLPRLPDGLLRFPQSIRGKTKPENTLYDYSQLWYEHNMPCEDCFSKDEPTCPQKTIR